MGHSVFTGDFTGVCVSTLQLMCIQRWSRIRLMVRNECCKLVKTQSTVFLYAMKISCGNVRCQTVLLVLVIST